MCSLKPLKTLNISGFDVLPILEGGKGVAVSNGYTSGAFAAAGAVGTLSAVNPDSYDENGEVIRQIYHGKTRSERFKELIAYAIRGGVEQAQIAHDISGGKGPIHMNVLWEAGGTEKILEGIMTKAKGLIHGVTCGAGMPYKLAEIVARHQVYAYPIISSARAFRALWKRAYSKYPQWLGGVVYEDPWLAGGHNGLSNSEDPLVPGDPYPRVLELRKLMEEIGLKDTPIIMAGGVWYLRDWVDWIDNPELGPIVFLYGTRPLLTKESPISEEWKNRLPTLKEDEVALNQFSPTGFYSSAVNNNFLRELRERSDHQVAYTTEQMDQHTEALPIGARGRPVYLTPKGKLQAMEWMAAGFVEAMKTPDSSLIFMTPERAAQIQTDQQNCMCCLSQCRFSNWADNEKGTTGKRADPRSFCIQKTLQDIAHGGPIDENLMFSGHNGFKFASDPFYANGFVPSVAELVSRIESGD